MAVRDWALAGTEDQFSPILLALAGTEDQFSPILIALAGTEDQFSPILLALADTENYFSYLPVSASKNLTVSQHPCSSLSRGTKNQAEIENFLVKLMVFGF